MYCVPTLFCQVLVFGNLFFKILAFVSKDFVTISFYLFNYFRALCPNAWIEKWDDQRERGAFPAKLD